MATATYDKTASTMGRSVDSVLWPMLCAKSQLLDRIPKMSVDNTKFEWETANTTGKTFLAEASGGVTDINGSTSGTKIGCGLITGRGVSVEVGSIIRNASVATPIGTHGVDELMQVTANAGADGSDITVQRNWAIPVGSAQNTGSNAHTATSTYEILYSPKLEGSSPSWNRYTDVTLVTNFTQIMDFYLTVTGSQLASKRLVAGDSLQRQFDDRLVELKNEMESMVLYGAVNVGSAATQAASTEANAWAGTAAYYRTSKGLQNFLAVTGGNVDYTSVAVTETAINNLVVTLLTNGVDMSDKFLVVTHPVNIQTISSWGADKVRVTQNETKWGRALKNYETDLGVDLELVPCLNCSKSDLFIVDTKKIFIAEFRPFVKFEWGIDTSTPDGTDAWKQRYLGELGVKVVDGAKSHGLLSKITW